MLLLLAVAVTIPLGLDLYLPAPEDNPLTVGSLSARQSAASFEIRKMKPLPVLAFVLRPTLGLDLYMPVPESNPLTAAKVALGRRLFFDKRLARDGTLACASCHDPKLAFSDGRTVPLARVYSEAQNCWAVAGLKSFSPR